MRRWVAAICLCLAVTALSAQNDEAARANALYLAGKRPEALPLYENLAKAHPTEQLYFERLADCLGAEAAQLSDPAEVKSVRTRERDAAKRAVELGDTAEFVRQMATIDPSQPIFAGVWDWQVSLCRPIQTVGARMLSAAAGYTDCRMVS